jgi:hypothetical protein
MPCCNQLSAVAVRSDRAQRIGAHHFVAAVEEADRVIDLLHVVQRELQVARQLRSLREHGSAPVDHVSFAIDEGLAVLVQFGNEIGEPSVAIDVAELRLGSSAP